MGFLAPLWLLAAAAVAMPILLHLRHRAPPRVIRVGSVADLVGRPAAERRRRIEDPWLLLLRIGIVAMLALLLARPQLVDRRTGGRTVAVVPGDLPILRDSLRAAGLAVLDLPGDRSPWTLAQRADARLAVADTLLVVVPADADRYGAVRPTLRHPARGLTAEGVPAPPFALAPVTWQARTPAFAAARDTLHALTVRLAALVAPSNTAPPRVLIAGDSGDTPWSAAGLGRGWLGRPGALDTLLDALHPDTAFAPSPRERVPSTAATGGAPPRRDGHPVLWWTLVGMIALERGIAWRRHA